MEVGEISAWLKHNLKPKLYELGSPF
jgi:hypothetical protein